MMLRTILVTIVVLLSTQSGHAQEYQAYFGLLHGHTSFSDGSGTPKDAFKMAKEAGLDFIAITEHNHSKAAGDDGIFLTPQNYKQLKEAATAATKNGEFVAIYGQEVSTISAGNHVNIFNASEICNIANGDFRSLYETWLPQHQEVPFIQFNHPNARKDENSGTSSSERQNDYGLDDYGRDYEKLIRASEPYVALIELVIGPAFSKATNKPHHNAKHEADYIFYLNKGFRLGPSVGQDNHNKTWGVATHARLGVWAKSLTRADLFDALTHRRCFASEDENIKVMFTLNGNMMGSKVKLSDGGNCVLKVSISDEDEPDAQHRIQLYYDKAVGGGPAEKVEDEVLPHGESEIQFSHMGQAGGYYFAKVIQTSDHVDDVWTSPIWLTSSEEVLTDRTTPGDDEPRDEISWEDADQYVGEEKVVVGKIVRTYHSGKSFYLNFDPDFRSTLSLYVAGDDIERVGGVDALTQFSGKNVRVKGKIRVYKDMLQIKVTQRDQIISTN